MPYLAATEQGTVGAAAGAEQAALVNLWQEALEALLVSQEWAQLQSDLVGTPGGGPSAAALTLRALRAAVQQTKHAVARQQGPAAGTGLGAAPPLRSLQQLVVAVQQAAWEKLHSGCWHEVGVVWRDAYSLSCLLAAAGAVLWPPAGWQQWQGQSKVPVASSGSGGSSREGAVAAAAAAEGLREALRELDMAAIMGGPLFRPYVDMLIEQLQAAWQRLAAPAGEDQQGQRPGAAPVSGSTPQQQGQEAVEEGPTLPLAAQSSASAEVPLPPGSMGPRGTPVPLEELPSLETFWREYMNRQGGPIPVLIDGAMENWPALSKWQDVRYLRSVAGPRIVPVEVGEHYLADQWGQQLMTLKDFIDAHILGAQAPGQGTSHSPEAAAAAPAPADGANAVAGEVERTQGGGCWDSAAAAAGGPAAAPAPLRRRGYLAQHPLFEQIPALAADIREPDYCCLGEAELQSVCAWFGPAGTVTPLHTDPHHNLLCQVVGRKYLRLYCPEDTPAMYSFSEGMTTNSSQVDMDTPDHSRFPRFAAAHFQDCILRPGQMLYIPPGWWHYVKALDTSFSVSFWWK